MWNIVGNIIGIKTEGGVASPTYQDVYITFGSASSPSITDTVTWNESYADTPSSYSLSDLVDGNNTAITGLDVASSTAVSYNLGPSGAGHFAANVCAGGWNPPFGTTRNITFNIPVSHQDYPREIQIIGSRTSGDGAQGLYTINSIQKTIANINNNVDTYVEWSQAELQGTEGASTLVITLTNDGVFGTSSVVSGMRLRFST